MKGFFKTANRLTNQDAHAKQLIDELIAAKRELKVAIDNFNYADRGDLIDLYSHQITVAQSRYDVLIKNARSHNLKCDQYLLDKVNL